MELIGGSSRWKTAFAFAVAAMALVVTYWLRSVLLLCFLSLLVSILLDAMARWGMRWLRLPRGVAVILAAVVFLAGLAAALALIAFPLVREGTDLVHSMPKKLAGLERKVEQYRREFPWLSHLFPAQAPQQAAASTPQLAKRAFFTVSTALEGGAEALAAFFLALFLAWDPERWLRGIGWLWPGPAVEEHIALLRKTGEGLRNYLFALGLYVVLMGCAWALGLWLIGIDYPLLFGAIGGLAEVVPYIGPMLALLPPLIVAMTMGGTKILYVLLLYAVLHVLEGYVLVPLVMQQRGHLPPPIVVLSILVCGKLFGTMGAVLAVPLGTAAYILVNETAARRGNLIANPDEVQRRAA